MSAKDNLSGSQFPDFVPSGLQRPDVTGQDRIFLSDRPFGGGSDQPRSVTDSWRAASTKFESVPGYAPTAEDFKDMGPARTEGSISVGAIAKAHVDAAINNFGGPLYWLGEKGVTTLNEENNAVVRNSKLPFNRASNIVDKEGRRYA